MMYLEGFTPYGREDIERYRTLGLWEDLTFGDLLDRAARAYPDKEALVDSRSRLTYAQLLQKCEKLAIGLMNAGIQSQERVLLQLPNWNEFFYSYFALQKIGAIPVLLLDRHRQHEIHNICQTSGATSWIVAERYENTEFRPIVEDVLEHHSNGMRIIYARGNDCSAENSLDFLMNEAEFSEENLAKLSQRKPNPLQVAHMGPTGGSTGLPKIVPRTHNDYLCRVKYSARGWGVNKDDISLAATPASHDLAFSMVVCSTLYQYGKLIMLDSTRIEDICRAIEREKVTAIAWVPTLTSRLLQYEHLEDHDLSSLQRLHCGGGASDPQIIRQFLEKFDCEYILGYGATEGMSTMAVLNERSEINTQLVSTPCCPHDLYRITGPDGEILPPNTQGELVVKGPCLFTGYYNAPQDNRKVFDDQGFFKTGDLAVIDESGGIKITGRIKEIINRGGKTISAREIERQLIQHPLVAAVAVIGMPDPELGERICAYIQPESEEIPTEESLIAFLKAQKIAKMHLPERIEYMDSLPLTKVEKVDKMALLEDIKAKLRQEI